MYSFKYLSDHTLTNHTFYLGNYIFSKNPPWHYHLVWILVSTPTLYLTLFIIGFIFIAQRITKRLLKIEKNDSYIDLWRGNKELQDLIFFLTFLIPLIVAIDFRSISYDFGRNWTKPVKTNFPDARSKFYGLHLKNGKYILISNTNQKKRDPLTIAISDDGILFNKIAT